MMWHAVRVKFSSDVPWATQATESSGRKYIWIILLYSNTNDFCSGFHRADCSVRQHQPQHATWSECISTVCWMAVYSVPSWETAIVWNQPNRMFGNTASELPYFDSSVAVPDLPKKPVFYFDSRTSPSPQEKENWTEWIIRLLYFA